MQCIYPGITWNPYESANPLQCNENKLLLEDRKIMGYSLKD